MGKKWYLTGGVIIIGSLLWEDHLNNILPINNYIRNNWRKYHIENISKIMVKLPIRYGRCSDRNIFTMVFSNNCQRYKRTRLGTGYIYQFKTNPITNFKQIICEARAMSIAEGMNGNFWGGNRDIWGNMGILFNTSKIEKIIKNEILCKWAKEFFDNNGNSKMGNFKFSNERPCLTNKGELTIKWVEPVDEKDSNQVSNFDFLIATATVPNHKVNNYDKYPEYDVIANSVKSDTDRYYFINNVLSGISTFQDNKILNEL